MGFRDPWILKFQLAVAQDQGVVGVTQLFRHQAQKARVQAAHSILFYGRGWGDGWYPKMLMGEQVVKLKARFLAHTYSDVLSLFKCILN